MIITVLASASADRKLYQLLQAQNAVTKYVFLMDMLSSEEVYLLDMISIPVRVIPSVDEMQYLATPDEPAIFTLKLDIADTETNIMQEIIDGTEGKKPRVFSKQFKNSIFNNMDETSQTFIDGTISEILNATEAESVSSAMVGQVFDYLNKALRTC